jgi:hypothetical protein
MSSKLTAKEQRLRIWRSLTPAQRDYDRFAGKIPTGASWTCETPEGQKALDERRAMRGRSVYEDGCSCHISPPCSYCTRIEYDDLDDAALAEAGK